MSEKCYNLAEKFASGELELDEERCALEASKHLKVMWTDTKTSKRKKAARRVFLLYRVMYTWQRINGGPCEDTRVEFEDIIDDIRSAGQFKSYFELRLSQEKVTTEDWKIIQTLLTKKKKEISLYPIYVYRKAALHGALNLNGLYEYYEGRL